MRTAADVRDPRTDPRPGDVVRDSNSTYEVIHKDFGMVCFIWRVNGLFRGYDSCSQEDWIDSSGGNEVLHVAE